MVEIVVADELEQEIWETLIALARERPDGWTLIGAQMVALHGFEAGRERPRLSTDADILVNVRVVPTATKDFSTFLRDFGFDLEEISAEGIGHRFARGQIKLDVLAPDGVGDRANLKTIGTARTIPVPGGTQALNRTELVEVQLGGITGPVPRPSLVGAILIKARAVDVDDLPDAQRQDLAFLLSLVADPIRLVAEMTDTERGWLRKRSELKDQGHSAWGELPADRNDDAYAAFSTFVG